jgi:hypothetical protein
MLSLIYVSSAVRPFSRTDLISLLERSRAANARADITGMLLYQAGNFIQALEGPADAVQQLFTVIQADDRHERVQVLIERPLSARQFPDWSMGFQDPGDSTVRDLPGYSDFLKSTGDTDALLEDPGVAQRLLEIFRRDMTR